MKILGMKNVIVSKQKGVMLSLWWKWFLVLSFIFDLELDINLRERWGSKFILHQLYMWPWAGRCRWSFRWIKVRSILGKDSPGSQNRYSEWLNPLNISLCQFYLQNGIIQNEVHFFPPEIMCEEQSLLENRIYHM